MLDIDKYKDYLFDTVKRIMSVASPSGYYKNVMSVIQELAVLNGLGFEMTKKGNAILFLKGNDSSCTKGLCAHCDTLGAMVRSISCDGTINFTLVGGPLLPTLDGEYCTIITRDGREYTGTFLSRSPSVHVYADSKSRTRDEENMFIRLDEVVKNSGDVEKLGIMGGDYICIDPKTVITPNGFLKSRFIDDKASVACLITAAHILNDTGLRTHTDIKILITMNEEVGHGASFVPEGLCSMLAVDMGCIGKDLKCTEYDVSICAKDGGGPYDYYLTGSLIDAAKRNNLSFAVDIYPYYGSDIGAMWRAGYDVPGALIGPGVHASHGMERTHYLGLKNTIAMILLYMGIEL